MARSLLWFLNTATASATPTDADLLGRFAATRDAAAFELIVRRHSGAVAAVCRRVLRHDADAEDAFQATFFTLAKHAGSVRAGRSLGGWLYRVAVNAARKLRAKRRPAAPLPDVPAPAPDFDDSAAALHAELARLPKAYQAVRVAVDLEGHSHADAAALLGWPVGTVSGRLVRAREELKRRLARRGIVGAALVTGVAGEPSVRAAVELASGAAVATPGVLSLSAEVWAMTTSKLKLAVACGLAALAVGAGVFGLSAVGQEPKPGAPTKPVEKKAEDKPIEVKSVDDLPDAAEGKDDTAEVKAAKGVIRAEVERYKILEQRRVNGALAGGVQYTQYTDSFRNLFDALPDAYPAPKDQLVWFEYRLKLAKGAESFNQPRVEKGIEEPQLLPQLQAERAKAELALLKLKKKIK